MNYLQGYPATTLSQVAQMLQQDKVADWLLQKYPQAHTVRTDKALFDYVQALKQDYLRGAEPLNKVLFDSKLHVVKNALGTHTSVSRVQGNKLKAKREIRIASLFKNVPDEFLRMITVHELAHLKEKAHDKAFYQLCKHMEFSFYYHLKTVDRRTVDMARGRSEFLSTDQTTPKNSNQLTANYLSHNRHLAHPKQNGCNIRSVQSQSLSKRLTPVRLYQLDCRISRCPNQACINRVTAVPRTAFKPLSDHAW